MLTEDLEALLELQSMFNVQLHEQEEQLNAMEGNLSSAAANAAQGNSQLMAAVRHKTARHSKKVALAAAVMGFCIGGPVGAAVGGSVSIAVVSAGATAVVGGTATAGAVSSWNKMRLRMLERKDPSRQRLNVAPLALPPPPSSSAASSSTAASSSVRTAPRTGSAPAMAGSFADAAKALPAGTATTARHGSFQRPRATVLTTDGAGFAAAPAGPAPVVSQLKGAVADGSMELYSQREQLERCRDTVRHFQEQMAYSEVLLKALGVSAAGAAGPVAPKKKGSPGSPTTTTTAAAPELLELPERTEEREEDLKERDRLYRQAAKQLDAIAARILVAKGEEKRRLTSVMADAMKACPPPP